jgi:hypothetical protein
MTSDVIGPHPIPKHFNAVHCWKITDTPLVTMHDIWQDWPKGASPDYECHVHHLMGNDLQGYGSNKDWYLGSLVLRHKLHVYVVHTVARKNVTFQDKHESIIQQINMCTSMEEACFNTYYILLGGKGGWHIRLTTLLPSVSRLSRENVGALTSHNPMGLHNLLQG